MDNTADTRAEILDGEGKLPLYSFFILLKHNGYPVTPRQITDANKIISRYSPMVNNEVELCDYLTPLFAQTEDEQRQFKELFTTHFRDRLEEDKDELDLANIRDRIINHIRDHKWKYLVAVAAMVITIVAVRISDGSAEKLPVVLSGRLASRTSDADVFDTFRIKTRESLQVYPQMDIGVSNKGRLRQTITGVATYDWGDASSTDTTSHHQYRKEGNYIITAYTRGTENGNVYTDTINAYVKVCNNGITVTPGAANLNEPVKLRVDIAGRAPTRILWSQDVKPQMLNTTYETTFRTEGLQTVNYTAIYDSLNSPCTYRGSVSVFVFDPSEPSIAAYITNPAGASGVSPQYRIKPLWFFLLGALLILSFLLNRLLRRLYERFKQKAGLHKEGLVAKYDTLLSSFSGKKPPFEVPFRNKNYMPVPEPGLNELARQMRRRINDETMYLDLPRTIQRTIVSGGLFQPVNIPRTQQSEYLVLIDASHRNNQQVKLFEYLLDILGRQNVHIEKYYYREDLQHCYNLTEPAGIGFDKLSEKYPRYVLLVFGNAYELLFEYYPVFNYQNIQLLNRWQYKAILTPQSFPDWGSKELKGLSPAIPVYPVDGLGLLLFIHTIFNEEQNIIPVLFQQQRFFYEVEKVDFENIHDLEVYCAEANLSVETKDGFGNNLLFQWVAGLAIYPKIKWEIILCVGKALLDRHGVTEELNYSNLLRIARIKWMRDGQFPDHIRLDLLKSLSKEHEILARETVLSLLKEIPETEVNHSHFAYEEKEIQRIVNEFNLYAFDNNKYASYKESEVLFEQLWKDKKIKDSPAKVYFKRGNDWDTLVNVIGNDGHKVNVGIEDYIGPSLSDSYSGKFYRWAILACPVIFTLALAGFIALTILNFTRGINLGVFTRAVPKAIKFTFNNNTGDQDYNTAQLVLDTSSHLLASKKTGIVNVIVNKNKKPVSLTAGGKTILDTSMIIDRDAYVISFDIAKEADRAKMTVNIWLSDKCSGQKQVFERIVKETDSTLLIRDSVAAEDPANQKTGCLNQISFGSSVSRILVDRLIQNFKERGLVLQVSGQSYRPVAANEIAIYYYAGLPVARPVIYVQYNNRQSQRQAQQLQNCLQQGVFSVPGIELKTNFRRNEIRYYDNSFRDTIATLQACLRSIYPGKTFYPVLVPSRQSAARAEIWIYDSIQAIDPATASYQKGLSSFRAGNYREALKSFTDAIAANYKDPVVYRYRGQCYSYLNQSQLACNDYKKASDAGDKEANNLYLKNCGTSGISAEEILNNVELHVQRNAGNKSENSLTYYLKGDPKYLDKIRSVRYPLYLRNPESTSRGNGFGITINDDKPQPASMEISIETTDKASASKTMRLISDPDKGEPPPSVDEIAANIEVRMLEDSVDAYSNSGKAIRVSYFLVGDKRYLDNIALVRYALVSPAVQDQKRAYTTSTDRASGFRFVTLQSIGVNDLYFIITAKDKTESKEMSKRFDSRPKSLKK